MLTNDAKTTEANDLMMLWSIAAGARGTDHRVDFAERPNDGQSMSKQG
jgi:hypothetical protein